MKLNKYEIEIIKNALIEYEEKHYLSENASWQNTINILIDLFKYALLERIKNNETIQL